MERRLSFVRSVVALLATATLTLAQDPEALGEHGTRIASGKGWKRTRFDENVEGEQFLGTSSRGLFGGKQVYAIVREHLGQLDGEADYRRVFGGLEDLPSDTELTVATEAGRRRVTRIGDKTINGLRLVFRSELLVVDGYALHFLCWATRADRKLLDTMVEQLVAGTSLPGADSAWQRDMQPVRQTIAKGTASLSFAFRPFVLRPFASEGTLAAWRTGDEVQGFSVMEIRGAQTAAQAVERDMAVLRDDDESYHELRRAPRRIGDVDCLEQWGATTDWGYRVLVVPCGSDRWLVVRYWAPGSPDTPRAERDALFASMQVQPVADQGLPPLPDEPVSADVRPAAVRAFLANAKRRFAHSGWLVDWVPGPDDSWLALEHGAVHQFADAGMRTWLSGAQGVTSAVVWHGAMMVVAGGEVRRIAADGKATVAPFAATHLARAGTELLCVRTVSSALPLGGGASQRELWLRRIDGSERRVTTITGAWLIDVAVADDGKRALLLMNTLAEDEASLVEIDLVTGARGPTSDWRPFAGWMPVSLGSASTGWLVNGAPVGQSQGVWHLTAAAPPRLLVGGTDMRGVRLQGDELWLAHRDGRDDVLASMSLAACAEHGPRITAVHHGRLALLGIELLAQQPTAPRSKAEVVASLARLQQIAREQLGHELPLDAVEIDHLLAVGEPTSRLAAPGRIVLTLLLAGRALADGAEWVASDDATWLDWVVAAEPGGDHAFVVVRHLPTALVAAFDDSEGDTAPAQGLTLVREGRRLLCGVDRLALTAAAAAAVPAEFVSASANGDPRALLAIASSHPTNLFLRSHVYKRLGLAGAWRELVDFAGEGVAAKLTGPEHHVAWLFARDQLATTVGTADAELERDVLAALTLHGREARLWLLLGGLCERRSPPVIERARASYERAFELQRWGEVADLAEAALQRLAPK